MISVLFCDEELSLSLPYPQLGYMGNLVSVIGLYIDYYINLLTSTAFRFLMRAVS